MMPTISLRKVRSTTVATIQNEQITRERVERLEAWATQAGQTLAPMSTLHVYLQRGFWARLRWLITGQY